MKAKDYGLTKQDIIEMSNTYPQDGIKNGAEQPV